MPPLQRKVRKMEKLTPKVLNAAYLARGGGDCKELFLNSMLMTYVDENKEIKKDQASQVFLGKCNIPKAIVRFYAAGASHCPPKLYDDFAEYFKNTKTESMKTLRAGLYEILKTIPEEDEEDILRIANARTCEKEKTYTLLTCMIYYAWRSDLAGYIYSNA